MPGLESVEERTNVFQREISRTTFQLTLQTATLLGEKQLNIIFKIKNSKLTFSTLLGGRVTWPRTRDLLTLTAGQLPIRSDWLHTLTPPKSPTTVDHLNNLLVLAKSRRQPYIIVVFEGGPLTPLGLLQELHSQHVLSHIPIFLPEETKDRHKPRVSCCPFCAYTVQNDPAYLNHIINTHNHMNFTCGTCLSAVTTLGQQMKRHISECPGLAALPKKSSQGSACSEHSPKKHAYGNSGSKSKHGGSKNKQSHQSGKSQLGKTTSQEDSQTSNRHLTHVASMSQESTTEELKKMHKKKKKSSK